MPFLPISEGTLIYGSADAGRTVHSDADIVRVLKECSILLHLAEHGVRGRVLYSAGDLEVHHTIDGAYYMIDLARCFPPESAQVVEKRNLSKPSPASAFFRLLRPEFLQVLKSPAINFPPLSSDANSRWGLEDAEFHNSNVEKATELLISRQIPLLVSFLDSFSVSQISQVNISIEFHRYGINMRYLGLVLQQLKNPEIQIFLVDELLKRTLKNIFRRRLRQSSSFSNVVSLVECANSMYKALQIKAKFSVKDPHYSQVVQEISERFGSIATSAFERCYFTLPNTGKVVLFALRSCGINLSPSSSAELQQNLPGFHFVKFDFIGFTVDVKKMPIFETATARVLVNESALARSRFQSQRLRVEAVAALNRIVASFPSDNEMKDFLIDQKLLLAKNAELPEELDRFFLELLSFNISAAQCNLVFECFIANQIKFEPSQNLLAVLNKFATHLPPFLFMGFFLRCVSFQVELDEDTVSQFLNLLDFEKLGSSEAFAGWLYILSFLHLSLYHGRSWKIPKSKIMRMRFFVPKDENPMIRVFRMLLDLLHNESTKRSWKEIYHSREYVQSLEFLIDVAHKIKFSDDSLLSILHPLQLFFNSDSVMETVVLCLFPAVEHFEMSPALFELMCQIWRDWADLHKISSKRKFQSLSSGASISS
jgi:hypothetical protein